MDSLGNGSWLSKVVRGRQRRRTRRNVSLEGYEELQTPSTGLRGRPLRNQKRHARVASQHGLINGSDSTHAADTPSQKHTSLLSMRPRLREAGRSRTRQGRRSVATHSHSGSVYASPDARLTLQRKPLDESRPAWLLDAGVKWPLQLRKISEYLEQSKPPSLLLDTAMVDAIRTIGADHSNELLTTIMDGCLGIVVTATAMSKLVKWTSLPLIKRLESHTVIRPKRDLLRTAMNNPEHCMDIYGYLTDDYEYHLDPLLYNALLETAIISSATVPFTLRGRFEDDLDPAAQAHFKKLCDILLFKYGSALIYASTVASAIQAEINGRPSYHDPEPWPATRLLLARCTEDQDTTALLEKALKDSSLTTVRLLLEKFPNANISKHGLLGYFRRQRRGSSRFRALRNGDQDPLTKDEIYIQAELIRRWEGRPFADVVFLNCQDYNEGPAILKKLLTFNVKVEFSGLMARFLVRTFSAKDLQEGLTFEDEDCNKTNLKAAMEEQGKQNRRRDQTVIRFIAMRVPRDQLSTDVMELAAQATSPSLFSKILSRCPAQELPSTVLLSAMRSSYPAVWKVKLLLGRLPSGSSSFDADFLPALISMNHPDTLKVLKILQRNHRVRSSDSSIVAAWRTDDADRIVRQLIRDKSFHITRSTISAILREDPIFDYNSSLLRYLLKRSNHPIIDSDLLTDALSSRQHCRILLSKHGAPWQLCLNEANLLGSITAKRRREYSASDLDDLGDSLEFFMQAGGRVTLTEKLLKVLGEHDPQLALKLWRLQTSIDFYTMLGLVFGEEQSRHDKSDLFDLWLSHGPAIFDARILQTFDRLVESRTSRRILRYSGFWDDLLELIQTGERSRFEQVYARLGVLRIPCAAIEHFCAQVVSHFQPRAPSDVPAEDVEPSNIFAYVVDWLGPITLGEDFFQSLLNIDPRFNVRDNPESALKNWEALSYAPIDIKWSPLADEVMFTHEPYEVGIKIMAMLGVEPALTDNVVLAAIASKSGLLKLEYIWQHKHDMLVTVPMIEAAVRTTVVEVVDFLLARSDLDCITEEVMVMAMRGVEPGEKEDAPYFYGRPSRSSIVECLLAQVGDVVLSLSSLELAVRNLHERVAERLLVASTHPMSKALVIAMVQNDWQSERILRILRRANGGIEHLEDQEVLETLVKTEHGQSFLLFAKSGNDNIRSLVEEERFKTCLMRSNSKDWAILDHLSRISEVDLDDTTLAHIWKESTQYTFSHKQALYHMLESGATGRIGAKTFGMFYSTCMDRKYGRSLDTRSRPRVISQLPPLPVDINQGVISAAKNGWDGRTALDYVLGPDHKITIHESALRECARLREELWLLRLLQRMTAEELAKVDKDALLDAAMQGGHHSIIELCRALAGEQPPEQTSRQTTKTILRRERYAKRQRLRAGQPKIVRPLRRAFFRFYSLLRTSTQSSSANGTHAPLRRYTTAERQMLKHLNRGISGLKHPMQFSPHVAPSDYHSDGSNDFGLGQAFDTSGMFDFDIIDLEEQIREMSGTVENGVDAGSSSSSDDGLPWLREDESRRTPELSVLTDGNNPGDREEIMRATSW